MRRRLCNGKNCVGGNQEWRTCNEIKCKGNLSELEKKYLIFCHFRIFNLKERLEAIYSDWDLIETNKESEQKLEKRYKFSAKYDHSLETISLNGMEMNYITEYRLCLEENSCRSFSKNTF